MFFGHKALESIGKVGNHNARVQRWLEFLTAIDYTLDYRKGSANGNADFLSRLPEPATEHDRSGSSLNPVEDGGIYLIRACGQNTPSSPIPGAGLSGLVPRTESAVLGGLLFTSTKYGNFRTHGPRMRIDDLSAPSGSFVARVSAFVVRRSLSRARAGFAYSRQRFRFGLCRTHRGRHGLRRSPGCRDDRRPVDSFKEFYTGDRLDRDGRLDRVHPCLAWPAGAPDGEAVFGPHLYPDGPTYSNSSWQCAPCCRL